MDGNIIGRGWNFPITPGADGRLSFNDGAEKVKQSIWLILSTAPGERQMLPDFGCGIHDLVFEANTASLRGVIQVNVQQALTKWEPRIDVLDVHVETVPDQRNYLLIRIHYRLRANNNPFNLVYPFFLTEGSR